MILQKTKLRNSHSHSNQIANRRPESIAAQAIQHHTETLRRSGWPDHPHCWSSHVCLIGLDFSCPRQLRLVGAYLFRNLLVKISQVESSWRSVKPCYQDCFWFSLVVQSSQKQWPAFQSTHLECWLLTFTKESNPVSLHVGWRGFLFLNLLVKISQVESSWRSAKPCYQNCFW